MKRKKCLIKDYDEYEIVENTHEAIVTKEQFVAVNEDFKKRRVKKKEDLEHAKIVRGKLEPKFTNLFYCGCCGKRMNVQYQVYEGKARFIAYRCTNKDCKKRQSIEERYLQILVMDQIRAQLKLRIDFEKVRKDYVSSTGFYQKKKKLEDAITVAEGKVNFLKRHKRQQYEACVAGDLSSKEFKALSEKMNSQINTADAIVDEAVTEYQKFMSLQDEDAFLKKWNVFSADDVRFSKELAEDCISRITYDEDGRINITFRIEDPFQTKLYLLEDNK